MKLKILGSVFLFAVAGAAPASDAEADPQFFVTAGFPGPMPSAFPVMDGDQRYVAQMMQGNHQFMGAAPMMPPNANPPPPVGHDMPFAQPAQPTHHEMVAGHGFESVHEMPPMQMMEEPHHMASPPPPMPGQFSAPEMAISRPYPAAAPQMPFGQPGTSSAPFTQPFYSLPSNCQREEEIIMTASCQPSLENVCKTETIQTEEIKYEKVCRNVVNIICGGNDMSNASQMSKREAEAVPEASPAANADASAQFFGDGMNSAMAVPNSAISSVKIACHEVTTEYCFDSPRVEIVPVDVEHCHRVTKANCKEEQTPVPKIICQPVEQMNTAESNSSPDYEYDGGDQSNNMYGGDQSNNMYGGDQSNNMYGADQSNNMYSADQSNNMYSADQANPMYGGDQSNSMYSGDQSNNMYSGDQSNNMYGGDQSNNM